MVESRFRAKARRALHPLYRRLETTVHPLRYLFLEITQRCNLRCRHCGSDCGKTPGLDELGTDEWLGFVDYLAGRLAARNVFLTITGGEPLCHPDLDRILQRIGERGFPFGIVTNGYALDKQRADRLVELGITSVTVSLDGTKADHDWLRGVKGSFHRALGAISLLARQPVRFFDVVTCVNPRNLGQLSKVLGVLRQAGVTRWRLFTIFPKGRAKDDPELLLEPAQLRELLGWIAAERPALAADGFDLDFSCEGYLPPETDAAVRSEPYFCRAGICIASVLCDGSISACPNITRDLIQGNVRSDDFVTIWDKRFTRFRDRKWMRTGDCVGCDQWKRCQGNSLHLWDDEAQRTALCHHRQILDR
jgi:radical SAM enzyme (rSAM/lipoprotein system)